MFRDLKAEEIECRVSTVNDKGCTLLLYKDARVDMNVLDETYGVTGWQREHTLIGDRLYCTVKIRDNDTGEWIAKQDVGTESYTEKEKGQASDSFKRACFNVGIGRELYTAPFIWVSAQNYNVSTKNGKPTTYDRFAVEDIEIKDKKIVGLKIVNHSRKTESGTYQVVYTFGTLCDKDTTKQNSKATQLKKGNNEKINKKTVETLEALVAQTNSDRDAMLGYYNVNKIEDMTADMATDCYKKLSAKVKQNG